MNITKAQARIALRFLHDADVYGLTVGEYMDYSMIVDKLESVLEDKCSVLVVSRSGCKFINDSLVHDDSCSCDDEYMEYKEL